MPTFASKLTIAFERLIGEQWGVAGRITEYRIESTKILGADRANDRLIPLSADLSAYPIPVTPSGLASGPMHLLFTANQPVDIRLNAASDAYFLSQVTTWAMGGYVSTLYVTTGSAETVCLLRVAVGSNASQQWSFPLP